MVAQNERKLLFGRVRVDSVSSNFLVELAAAIWSGLLVEDFGYVCACDGSLRFSVSSRSVLKKLYFLKNLSISAVHF